MKNRSLSSTTEMFQHLKIVDCKPEIKFMWFQESKPQLYRVKLINSNINWLQNLNYLIHPEFGSTINMTVARFSQDFPAQNLLFWMAHELCADVDIVLNRLLKGIPVKKKLGIKATTPRSMSKAIQKKVTAKGYLQEEFLINGINDLVRCRINVDCKEQIKLVHIALVNLAKEAGWYLKEIVQMRNQLTDIDPEMFGYSRIHLVFEIHGMTIECQIGLEAIEKFFEKKAIFIPEGFRDLVDFPEMTNDLHDVVYKLFYRIIAQAKNSPLYQYIADITNMKSFIDKVLFYAAKAGLYGEYPDFQRDLNCLHKEAGKMLMQIDLALRHPSRQFKKNGRMELITFFDSSDEINNIEEMASYSFKKSSYTAKK